MTTGHQLLNIAAALVGSAILAAGGGAAHSSSAGACPYPSSTDAGGCAGSPGGTLQHADFFTGYAQQSGQKWLAPRPAQNVAGVDYPVGYFTAGSKLDPVRHPPSGCVFVPAHSELACSGSGSITIQNYDFSLHHGVWLDLANYTGVCTIRDNYFKNGPASDVGTYALVKIESSNTCQVIATSNTYDGDAKNFPKNLDYIFQDNRTCSACGPTIHHYEGYVNIAQKGVSIPASASSDFRWNYGQDIEVQQFGHGEWTIYGGAAISAPGILEQYNTFLETSSPPNGGQANGGVTSVFYDTTGASSSRIAQVNNANNVVVVNRVGGKGGALAISTITEISYATFANYVGSGNWMDGTGVYYPWAALAGPGLTCAARARLSGNVDLVTGKTVNRWGAQSAGSGC